MLTVVGVVIPADDVRPGPAGVHITLVDPPSHRQRRSRVADLLRLLRRRCQRRHASIDAKRRRLLGAAAWQPFAAQTSTMPFAAILAGRNQLRLNEIGTWRWIAAIVAYALRLATSPAYALSGLTRLFGSRRPPSQSARAWSAWRAAPASPSAPARVSRVGPARGRPYRPLPWPGAELGGARACPLPPAGSRAGRP